MSRLTATRLFIGLALLKVAAGLCGFVLPERGTYVFPAWINLAQMAAYAAASAILLGGSRRDARATSLGAYFLGFASMFADRPLLRATGAAWPGVASVADWLVAFRPDAIAPAFLWLFTRDFPDDNTRAADRRVARIAIALTTLCGGWIVIANLASRVTAGSWHAIAAAFSRSAAGGLYWTALIGLTLPALVVMLLRAHRVRAAERRRVRLFLLAFVIGLAPMLLDVLLEALVPPFGRFMAQPARRTIAGLILYPLTLSIPPMTTYAVLVDRVLDVRLVIRTALRYALVKYAALALFVAPFVGTLLYLYSQRSFTPAGLFWNRLPILVALVLIAIAGVRYGPRLFDAIDRRFFREHYDARRVLLELVARSRSARTLPELTGLLTSGVDRALHVTGAALLTVDEGSGLLAAVDATVPPLGADSQLAAFIGGSPDPFIVNPHDQSVRRLPEKDRAWLDLTGFRVLVPLLSPEAHLIGVLGLGEKRSELPFSGEDLRLLADAGTSGSVALENLLMRRLLTPDLSHTPGGARPQPERVDVSEAALECGACGRVHSPSASACASCGGQLVTAPVPHVLAGKFRFEARIGSGGMGVVYRAVDLTLGRTVAIKTLPYLSAEYAQRLRREARAMASLSHPNLALIYGTETWQGTPMLLFEFLEGGTLADRLRYRAERPTDVVALGVRIADALGHVHRAGVLHRDVKPGNIGYRADGTPKLLDFGLAKILEPAVRAAPSIADGPLADDQSTTRGLVQQLGRDSTDTTSLRILGTPMYLSPEVVLGLPPDASSDLWALAIALYQAISLRNPFAGTSLFDTLDRIARAPIPDVRAFAPGCPEPLAGFFRRALSRQREERPADADAFKAALEDAGTG